MLRHIRKGGAIQNLDWIIIFFINLNCDRVHFTKNDIQAMIRAVQDTHRLKLLLILALNFNTTLLTYVHVLESK
jgi:pentose-5-phosphate-3-epimerase